MSDTVLERLRAKFKDVEPDKRFGGYEARCPNHVNRVAVFFDENGRVLSKGCMLDCTPEEVQQGRRHQRTCRGGPMLPPPTADARQWTRVPNGFHTDHVPGKCVAAVWDYTEDFESAEKGWSLQCECGAAVSQLARDLGLDLDLLHPAELREVEHDVA